MTQPLIGHYGAVEEPASALGATDPVDVALGVVGLYLQSFLNTYAAAPWQSLSRLDKVVRTVATHDPRRRWFLEKDLPALSLFRQGGQPQREAYDYRVMRDVVNGLWVFPPAPPERQHLRDPFVSLLTKMIDDAIARMRDACFVIAGDPDPQAAEFGSDVFAAAGLDALVFTRWDNAPPIQIEIEGTAPRQYDGVLLALSMDERQVIGRPFQDPSLAWLPGDDHVGIDARFTTPAYGQAGGDLTLTLNQGAVLTAEYKDASP